MSTVGYYVTVRREIAGSVKVGWLLGPFETKEAAEARVTEGSRLACEFDPRMHWDAFGVARLEELCEDRALPKGVLNERMRVEA
jgi:hypothetical protein